MTRGVRALSVGCPLRYPLYGAIYPLELKILLIDWIRVGNYHAMEFERSGQKCNMKDEE